MQIITTGLVFIDVAAEAQLIAVGLVLILAAVIDRTGSSFGRRLLSLLFTTRNKKMERVINVVLAIALVAVLRRPLRRPRARPSAAPAQGQSGPALRDDLRRHRRPLLDRLQGRALRQGRRSWASRPSSPGRRPWTSTSRSTPSSGPSPREWTGSSWSPMADAVTPAINKAIEAGIPVVCADADAPSSKRYLLHRHGQLQRRLSGRRAAGASCSTAAAKWP